MRNAEAKLHSIEQITTLVSTLKVMLTPNRDYWTGALADGRAFYFDFVAGIPDSTYTELTVPRWLEGRPQRFSGIEVVGIELDKDAIAKRCCEAQIAQTLNALLMWVP
jgi:hypothetical protein